MYIGRCANRSVRNNEAARRGREKKNKAPLSSLLFFHVPSFGFPFAIELRLDSVCQYKEPLCVGHVLTRSRRAV